MNHRNDPERRPAQEPSRTAAKFMLRTATAISVISAALVITGFAVHAGWLLIFGAVTLALSLAAQYTFRRYM